MAHMEHGTGETVLKNTKIHFIYKLIQTSTNFIYLFLMKTVFTYIHTILDGTRAHPGRVVCCLLCSTSTPMYMCTNLYHVCVPHTCVHHRIDI